MSMCGADRCRYGYHRMKHTGKDVSIKVPKKEGKVAVCSQLFGNLEALVGCKCVSKNGSALTIVLQGTIQADIRIFLYINIFIIFKGLVKTTYIKCTKA